MHTNRTLFAVAILVLFCNVARSQSPVEGFKGADWIWAPSLASQPSSFPAEVCYFRGELNLPRDAQVVSASVLATADNLFTLHVNGQAVGASGPDANAWNSAERFDIAKQLAPGRNVFAVMAVNTLPGPAGLLLKAEIKLSDGQQIAFNSDEAWRSSSLEKSNWQQLAFEDGEWAAVRVVGKYGGKPWGEVSIPEQASARGQDMGKVKGLAAEVLRVAKRYGAPVVEQAPGPDFDWPSGIVFVGGDCSLYRPRGATKSSLDSLNVTIFNPRNSRAFPEHDLPGPMKVGRKLFAITPAQPGVTPRLLLDAGKGGIGSPSVSFDGESLLFSMAREGESFFHIFRLSFSSGQIEQLTEGPFHDIDPAELPDGRIVFTSTRIGTFEEYHSPPSRSLFVMDSEGEDLVPLTHTLIFDNEPEVLSDGRILFIRSNNFFDRGKVETHLHAIHPDGTEGRMEFGLNSGPEYGNRLRGFDCGSPAPLPDGSVAFLSRAGISIGRMGSSNSGLRHFRFGAGDVAAMPDGRLLCTTARPVPVQQLVAGQPQTIQDLRFMKISILDPRDGRAKLTLLYESEGEPLHSPVYLGARTRPPVLPEKVDRASADDTNATGFLFCQNVRKTRNTTAGWSHVRAVRVLAGKGLMVRSSHSYIVHAGSEVTELGTVPLAADGSFHIEVPANTPLALQMVDAEGRSELNEMSWIYVRPGEHRGCVGCHQKRQAVPERSGDPAFALRSVPLKLLGQGDPHKFRGNNAAVTGLMELQFDRFREVAGLNRHVTPTVVQGGSDTEISTLIDQLRNGDTSQKISAAQRLAIFRDPIAAPDLANCLNDRSRELQVAAAMSLAVCGSRASIQPLLDELPNRELIVAQAAAVAIENLTGFAQPFDGFAPRADRQRQAEVWSKWFDDTNWQSIEARLIQRLKSDDPDAVRRAAVALGHTGGDAARAALREYLLANRGRNPLPAWRKQGHRGDAARFNAVSTVNPRTLQAVTRSLGYLRDVESIPMLEETITNNSDPETANLFLAEAAVEALGRMGSPKANAALIRAFAALRPYPEYTRWYGDHDALMACHASPIHYFITEAINVSHSTAAGSIVPQLIQSVPVDPDRALFLPNDDCESLVGQVIRRNGKEQQVVETCLSLLGDPDAVRDEEIATAVSTIHRCWAGEPSAENRAAQILSLVCRDSRYEARIRQTFLRYSQLKNSIPRLFDTGIPVVDKLPLKNWVCFYLARALGNLKQPESSDALIATLQQEPTEAANGRPDPLGVGVLFLHNGLTPCWRAAVAWALGQIGDRDAVPVLLEIVADLENAPDTRHAAAEALGEIGDPESIPAIRELAEGYLEISTRRTLLSVLEKLSEQTISKPTGT
ncbi:MAG: hypothetical protein GY903_09815 [Fuerstiella sp.]|nr:hypothetical protein [Fuerstiella sp.]